MLRNATLSILPVLFLVCLVSPASSLDVSTADAGRKMFVEKRCYKCHNIKAESEAIQNEKEAFAKSKGVELSSKGAGKNGICPDLSDIGIKRSKEFIEKYLKNPKPFFKDTPECQNRARLAWMTMRFKGAQEEFEVFVNYLSNLKYDSNKNKDFVSCIKEE